MAGLDNPRALVAEPSGWEFAAGRTVDVPFSFSQTSRERSGLSDRDRRVVECAAIVGRDFDWSHLPRMATQTEPEYSSRFRGRSTCSW